MLRNSVDRDHGAVYWCLHIPTRTDPGLRDFPVCTDMAHVTIVYGVLFKAGKRDRGRDRACKRVHQKDRLQRPIHVPHMAWHDA